MLGTPFYMAPEMVIGERADSRADIYAIGVIAFFMVTGQKPFDGGDVMELMTKIMNTKPPHVTDVDENLSPLWNPFIDKCLAKDVEDRYANAQEVVDVLDELISSFGCPNKKTKIAKTPQRAPSMTDSTAVEITKLSSSTIPLPPKRGNKAVLAFIACLLFIFVGYALLKKNPIHYGLQELFVQPGPGNLLVTWKSNNAYQSTLEVVGKKGVFLFHGDIQEKNEETIQSLPGLLKKIVTIPSEYCFQMENLLSKKGYVQLVSR